MIGIGYDGSTGYPAINIDDNLGTDIFKKLIASSLAGAEYAETAIDKFEKSQPKGCDTKYIAAGYSQGAMAARSIADMNNDVIGVIDFGDPYQMPGAPAIEGDTEGEGIVRSFLTGDGKDIVDAFYSSVDHQTTICHDQDPICSYSWLWGIGGLIANIDPHLTYMSVGDEATRKGKELADLAAEQWARGTTPTPAPRKAMDVVFAIDTTGSMGSYIDQARMTARTAASKVFGSARDGRVGLVEYRDYGDDFIAQTVVPLTSDTEQFYAGLDGLYPAGGGDWEEAVVSGVFEAVRADWNESASRSIIVIGDAPGHDPEVGTEYTFSQMADVLSGAAPVPGPWSPMLRRSSPDMGESRDQAPGYRPEGTGSLGSEMSMLSARQLPAVAAAAAGSSISIYGLSSVPELSAQLEPIVTATGGQLLPIESSDAVGDLILAAIDDASAAPEASLDFAGVPITGFPVVFSARGSNVAELPTTYEFDFDGDAIFEVISAEAVVEHVYPLAGTYEPSVRVTDGRGRTSTAAVTINVLPEGTATVQVPDPSNTATALEYATLSSPSMTVGAPALLTVADPLSEGERVGARLVLAGEQDPWMEPAVTAFEVPTTGTSAAATIPPGVSPGSYDLLVFTDRGRHAVLPLVVEEAAPAGGGSSPSPTQPAPLPQAGGVPEPAAVSVQPASARTLSATGGSADWLPHLVAGGGLLVLFGAVLIARVRRHPSKG
ncbi:VWA domain-containing protein [uncultured Microbacterium sp.]|uniref:VWA domain-containing protein n=1 Tax=uncultured Microbacterium sp. TaxID=191216 RepID=UPI00262EEBDA|nr:VWA domain-containing protein [uncultured Microbacterium sp.]